MAKNFTYMKKGDIIIMPYYKNIAIGEIISDAIHREDFYDDDASNTYEVKWIIEKLC